MVGEVAETAVGIVLQEEGGTLMIGVGAMEESLEEFRTQGALEEKHNLHHHFTHHCHLIHHLQ